jgi:hypothetical protein
MCYLCDCSQARILQTGPLVSSCSRYSSDFAYLPYREIGYLHHHTTVLAELKLCTFTKNHYCDNIVPPSARTMTRMLTKKRPPVQLPVDDRGGCANCGHRIMQIMQSAFRSALGPFTRRSAIIIRAILKLMINDLEFELYWIYRTQGLSDFFLLPI